VRNRFDERTEKILKSGFLRMFVEGRGYRLFTFVEGQVDDEQRAATSFGDHAIQNMGVSGELDL